MLNTFGVIALKLVLFMFGSSKLTFYLRNIQGLFGTIFQSLFSKYMYNTYSIDCIQNIDYKTKNPDSLL